MMYSSQRSRKNLTSRATDCDESVASKGLLSTSLKSLRDEVDKDAKQIAYRETFQSDSNYIECSEETYQGRILQQTQSRRNSGITVSSLVTATKSALMSLRDELDEDSSDFSEGPEEAYQGRKLQRTRSELSIPSLVMVTKSALKCVRDKVDESMERITQASTRQDIEDPEVEVNAAEEVSQRASAIAEDIAEFRQLKQNMRESGMITTFAMGQVLPTIIITGGFDDNTSQGSNKPSSRRASLSSQASRRAYLSSQTSRRASLSSQASRASLGSQGSFLLEKDEIGAYKWKRPANEQRMSKPIRRCNA